MVRCYTSAIRLRAGCGAGPADSMQPGGGFGATSSRRTLTLATFMGFLGEPRIGCAVGLEAVAAAIASAASSTAALAM